MEPSNDDAPGAKVFAVPELLENILLNLPLSRLFTFQRVNSTFKGVIGGSIAIRRRMFLEPTQLYDFEETNQFLSDKALRQATYPFTLKLQQHGAEFIRGPFIDAELSCSWMHCNRNGDLEELFRSHNDLKFSPSWRSIKMPGNKRGFATVISCESDYWTERYQPRCYSSTLGRVVDQVNEAACRLWIGPWEAECSKNNHLGPASR